MTRKYMQGLHHVTAISGSPQANVDFFTRVMSQRLVKKTVNFDDPGTYHLYYGNQTAEPGTILTFFPFADAAPGRVGPGMASAYAYALGHGAFDACCADLKSREVSIDAREERFGQRVLKVADPDGATVELIEIDQSDAPQLDGFHSITLQLDDLTRTQRLLTDVMGYTEVAHDVQDGAERLRLQVPGEGRGKFVDLLRLDEATPGKQGAGSIHHVAFRAQNDEDQLDWRERLLTAGVEVTPVIDRQYFNAIYFREPGGVLFEIATDPPGFTRDEDLAELGKELKLPSQYEPHRAEIEKNLPPLEV